MSNRDVTGIGRRVMAARLRLGLTHAELSRLAGAAPSYLSRLEAGHYGRPSHDRLARLACALGVTVDDLTGEAGGGTDELAGEIKRLAAPDRERVRALVAVASALPPEARADALDAAACGLRAVARIAGVAAPQPAPEPASAPAADAPPGWTFRGHLAPHLTPDLVDEAEAAHGHLPYRDARQAADLLIRLANEIRAERTVRPRERGHAS